MAHNKTYCMKCERVRNCLCGTREYQFSISYKVRVPSTANKVKFRRFLDECPIFVNMVEEHQRPMFLDLLRKVKYFNKSINGNEWTNIKK